MVESYGIVTRERKVGEIAAGSCFGRRFRRGGSICCRTVVPGRDRRNDDIDGDVVELTNKNRQLPALDCNLGKAKAEIMAGRFRNINPEIKLHVINDFIRDDRMIEVLKMARYDYIVDAIDTLAPKIFLIYHSLQLGLPVVSSMGSGGKLDPSKIAVADISKSYNCNLARMLRKRLHKLGVYKGVKVVFSSEFTDPEAIVLAESRNKKSNVGTISYMPPIFGCFIASVVVRDLIGE